jgi:hypothetical protein
MVMKRNPLAVSLILALLLFLSIGVPNFQVTCAVSETLQLIPEAWIVKVLELQKGDRVEGSFNISTLYFYKSLLDGKNYTYIVVVDLIDPEHNNVLGIHDIKGDVYYSFNVTTASAGRYTFRFYCSFNYFPSGAIVPQLTIVYNFLETTPLRVNVLSPVSPIYNESSLNLNFTLNKPVDWVGYSLDAEDNVTLYGNTTLPELSNGMHNIRIYAKTTYGHVGASEKIIFTVVVPKPFTVLSVAVSIATVVVVGVGLLVYFKKRKH